MSKIDDGGPAWPQHDLSGYGMGPETYGAEYDERTGEAIKGEYRVRGMSKREAFAMAAMQGLLASPVGGPAQTLEEHAAHYARASVVYADALLALCEVTPMAETRTPETGMVYNYLPPEGDITRHMWTLVGDNGAVHVWAEPSSPVPFRDWPERFYGGIEIHSKKPLYDYGDGKPHHEECWLLKCPCWHDGSSLQFSEQIEPALRHAREPFNSSIHEFVNSILFDRYQLYFGRRCA